MFFILNGLDPGQHFGKDDLSSFSLVFMYSVCLRPKKDERKERHITEMASWVV